MRKKIIITIMMLTVAVSAGIIACSGEDGRDGRDGQDAQPVTETWVTNDYKAVTNLSCVSCHAGQAELLASPAYTLSKMTADNAAAATSYAYGPHVRAANTGCGAACHQRVGQTNNTAMVQWLTGAAPTTNIGGASCVDCHGIENGHYARATIDIVNSENNIVANGNVSAAWDSCFNCHSNVNSYGTQHNPSHGDRYFGRNLGQAHAYGNHIKGISAVSDEDGNISDNRVCAFCHTDAYARKYNDFTGSKNDAEITAIYEASGEHTLAGMANTGMGCGTCHDSHTGGLRSDNNIVADEDDNVVYSSEFLLCTSCHVVKLNEQLISGSSVYAYYLDEAVYGTVEAVSEDAGHHFLGRTSGLGYMGKFVYNHFTTESGNGIIVDPNGAKGITAGYNINAGSRKPCTACHDPHQTTRFAAGAMESGNVVSEEELANLTATFAQSGHADYTSRGWNNARFGQGCMPCHNGREAAKYMDNATLAMDNTNAFSGMQPAYLQSTACGTCHKVTAIDERSIQGMLGTTQVIGGALREVVSFRLPGNSSDAMDTLDPAMVALMGDGMVCYTCHGGRTTITKQQAEYDSIVAAAVADGNIVPSISTAHYSAAAGIIGGTLLPKIKEMDPGRVEARIDPADEDTWMYHPSSTVVTSGTILRPTCMQCHDINGESHTFAIYKGADDAPVFLGATGDTTVVTGLYVTKNSDLDCGDSCHNGELHGNAIPQHLNYREVVSFFTEAVELIGLDATTTRNNAFWSAGDGDDYLGFKRFVVYQTLEVFRNDPGGYAHGDGVVKDAIGEALKLIYDTAPVTTPDAAGFAAWLESISDDGRGWLCGGADDCGDKYDGW